MIRVVLLTICIVILNGCAGTGTPNIHRFEAVGNYKEVIKIYKQKLAKSPNDSAILIELSDAYSLAGDFNNAEFYINRIDSHRVKKLGRFYKIKGDIYLGLDQPNKAIQSYLKSKENNYKNPELENGLGIAFAKINNLSRSNSSFSEAKLLNVNGTKVGNNIAVNLMREHKYKEAISILLPLYSQDKTVKTVKYNLGFSLLMVGAQSAASEVLKPDFSDDQVMWLSNRINSIKDEK